MLTLSLIFNFVIILAKLYLPYTIWSFNMGISLDQNLGVSTALNLFTVFTLPTGEQFNRNMAFVNTNFHTLVPKLFSADYDNQVPPQIPVQILSLLIVDHIEQMVCFEFNGNLWIYFIPKNINFARNTNALTSRKFTSRFI